MRNDTTNWNQMGMLNRDGLKKWASGSDESKC
jgi:hypothetical protein